MSVTILNATVPQFHRVMHHSPLLSEPLRTEEVIPQQADKIVDLLNTTRYYQVEKVVLDKSDNVKLVIVHPLNKNSYEGHFAMINEIHNEAGVEPPGHIEVDNYDFNHSKTGTVGLYY